MIGIIPSGSHTYIIKGELKDCINNTVEPEEGKLYIDSNGRLMMYSLTDKRSSPRTGYFPVWDGKKKYVSKFSNEKYFDKDATKTDILDMCSNIDGKVADQVLYQQRRSENDEVLEPPLSDGDNMFTQCIKGILNAKKYTLIDLVDMSVPKLTEKTIANYYSALTKITFMRLDKWMIWMDVILHMSYTVTIYKDGKKLLSYAYPENIFDTGIVNYDNITITKDDPFKKIIRILMIMENINKNSLRSKEVDDYTINNMMTTMNSKKALSAQLFSRFIRMANLSYGVHIFEDDNPIFEYRES